MCLRIHSLTVDGLLRLDRVRTQAQKAHEPLALARTVLARLLTHAVDGRLASEDLCDRQVVIVRR